MRQIIVGPKRQRLTILTGAALLALSSAPLLQGQEPLLSAATHAPVHRALTVGLSSGLEVAPEPPGGQNNAAPLKDDLFAGTEKFAKNATDAVEVHMDPDSLSLVDGPNANRAHRTLLNVVRHYEYDKPGMFNPADVDEFRRKLEGPDWHCSVRSRDLKTGESTDICSRHRPPDMIEQAIITVEPKELTFIHKISKANGQGGSLDTDGGGMSLLDGLPPEAIPAVMKPLMQADLLTSEALLKAEMPLLAEGLDSLPLGNEGLNTSLFKSLEGMKTFSNDMKGLTFEMTPEQERQLRSLSGQMQRNFAPVPPKLTPAPKVPAPPRPRVARPAPTPPVVPQAPSAPQSPSAPATPDTPAVPVTPTAR